MRCGKPLLSLALLLASCGQPAQHPQPGASASTVAGASASPGATQVPIHIETRGANGQYVRIVETIRGRKVYTIRALSGAMQRSGTNQATGDLEQPHITFFDRKGSTTIADAPKAHITERDKSVLMTGGVHARTSNGSVLSCDALTYYGNTERFHGEGHVHLTGPNGLTLAGEHLDGDTKLQDVTVTGGPG